METLGHSFALYFGKVLKKKKEIGQYHPPRGKPRWTIV